MNYGRCPNNPAVPRIGDGKTRRSKAELPLMALLNHGRKSATWGTRLGEGLDHHYTAPQVSPMATRGNAVEQPRSLNNPGHGSHYPADAAPLAFAEEKRGEK